MDKKQKSNNKSHQKNDNYFQYAVIFMLNHEEIRKYPQRKIKMKPFINKYNWEGINFLIEKKIWKI